MPVRENAAAPHLPAVVVGPGPVGEVAAARSRARHAGEVLLALGYRDGEQPDVLAARLDDAGLRSGSAGGPGIDGADIVAAYEPGTAAGSTSVVPLPPGRFAARRVVVLGLGDAGPDALRAAGAALGRLGRGGADVVVDLGFDLSPGLEGDLGVERAEAGAAAFVEGVLLGGWVAPRWTASGPVPGTQVPERLSLVADIDPAVGQRARTRALAVVRARILGATPSNIKNPAWMAAQARTIARRTGLDVRVRGVDELRAQRFGGLLAVGGGSATPPALVSLSWVPPRPAGRVGRGRTPHVVLVGKGITFDTGGLNLKPADGMLAMKTDMLGAGVVLAVLAACRDLEIRVRVTGLLPLAENAMSGTAYRPGDVITQYGGTTVEIGNTDAEGRIVLADGIAHAVADLDPDHVVDIATLTGAARIALARVMAPVFGNDPGLVDALVAAGEATGEALWPMPMPRSYRPQLASDVADIRQHVPGGHAGSVMAAMFLAHFAGETSWAHLDIAGTGRSEVDVGLQGKGADGIRNPPSAALAGNPGLGAARDRKTCCPGAPWTQGETGSPDRRRRG